MEVHFTPEQLAQLSQIATHAGTDAEHLVKDAALRLVEEDAKYRAAVREGIRQADRGELIDHEEVVARIERRLQSGSQKKRWTTGATADLERISDHIAEGPKRR